METTYRNLNMSKLKNRSHKVVSTVDALKNVTPIEWKNTVYTTQEKVIIDKQGIRYV